MSPARCAAFLICFAFAGCATSLDPARTSAFRRIGVVSVIGSDVQLQFTGTTAFGNRNKTEQAPDFQSDAVATDALLASLRGKYPEVIALTPGDRSLLPGTEKKRGFSLTAPVLWRPESPETAAGIRQIAAAKKLDAVVVAYPCTTSYGAVPVEGVGLAGMNLYGVVKKFSVFANVAVALFDGKTGSVLTHGWKRTGGGNPGALKLPFHTTLAEYSAAERGQIREEIQAQIRTNISGSIQGAGAVR